MFKKKSTRELVGNDIAELMQEEKKEKNKSLKPPREKRPNSTPIMHNRMVLGAVSVFVALFIAFGLTPIYNIVVSDSSSAVRVKMDVPRGTALNADMLEPVQVHARDFVGTIVTDAASAVGLFTATDLTAGDVLTTQKLSDTFPSGDPALLHLPDGKLAISIQMHGAAESVSGKLRAGDIIRLYAYLNNTTDSQSYQALSLPELQYVELLSVTNDNLRDLDNQADKTTDKTEKADKQIATLTLAVNPQQAAALAGLNNSAVLHAALVVRGDEAAKKSALAAQEEYFKGAATTAAAPADATSADSKPESTGTVTTATPPTFTATAPIDAPTPAAAPAGAPAS